MTQTGSTPSRPASQGRLTFLRIASLLAALGSIVSPLLAIGPLSGTGALNPLHGTVGTINLILAIIAAVAGFLYSRESGNKGLFMHALSLPLLAVIQIGLGEAGVAMVHIVLGFAYLLAAVALFTLTLRRR